MSKRRTATGLSRAVDRLVAQLLEQAEQQSAKEQRLAQVLSRVTLTEPLSGEEPSTSELDFVGELVVNLMKRNPSLTEAEAREFLEAAGA